MNLYILQSPVYDKQQHTLRLLISLNTKKGCKLHYSDYVGICQVLLPNESPCHEADNGLEQQPSHQRKRKHGGVIHKEHTHTHKSIIIIIILK